MQGLFVAIIEYMLLNLERIMKTENIEPNPDPDAQKTEKILSMFIFDFSISICPQN